jgi:cysteine desulfurase
MADTARSYLDWNATAPLRPEARAAMLAALEVTGNASSVHSEGRRARAMVERAREQVAALVGCLPGEVVFVSGATEANATVIAAGWDAVLVSDVEHPSMTAAADRTGRRTLLGVCGNGRIDIPDEFAAGRTLLCIQAANGETGILQSWGSNEPTDGAASVPSPTGRRWPEGPDERVRSRSFGTDGARKVPHLHTDATQAVGRVSFNFAASGAATAAISSHKLGGPQGVGALIIRDGTPVPALITGGGQERRRRAGTENVAGIAGFGAAAEAARLGLSEFERVQDLRDQLETRVLNLALDTIIVGRGAARLPNTSCLLLPGRSAETLLMQFDLAGIAISSGSACSSGKVGTSPVLAAMGVSAELARCAIRISLGWATTSADVEKFLAAFAAIARRPASVRDGAVVPVGSGAREPNKEAQHGRCA